MGKATVFYGKSYGFLWEKLRQSIGKVTACDGRFESKNVKKERFVMVYERKAVTLHPKWKEFEKLRE